MIYLDNAATTLTKPQQVIDAVYNALKHGVGNSGRGVYQDALAAAGTEYRSRLKLAQLFNAKSAEDIAFTSNATEALNIAIFGLISEGDHVISSDTEHNSVLRPLYHLEKEKGVGLDFIPADSKGVLDLSKLPSLIKPQTKAIVINHASNVTGNLNNLEDLALFAKEHDLFLIVDAAQTAGVFPIDMQKTDIDVVCFTGHKGLYGPMGTGGLAVRHGLELGQFKYGGTGIQSYNPDHPKEMPTRLEAGTNNGHGLAGLLAALEWIEATGRENIHRHEISLLQKFHSGLKDLPEVTIYGDFSNWDRAAVLALNLGQEDPAYISDILSNKYNIATRPGAHCAPRTHRALGTEDRGAVRFSFSYFNTEKEVDAALAAILEIIS